MKSESQLLEEELATEFLWLADNYDELLENFETYQIRFNQIPAIAWTEEVILANLVKENFVHKYIYEHLNLSQDFFREYWSRLLQQLILKHESLNGGVVARVMSASKDYLLKLCLAFLEKMEKKDIPESVYMVTNLANSVSILNTLVKDKNVDNRILNRILFVTDNVSLQERIKKHPNYTGSAGLILDYLKEAKDSQK